MIDKEKLNQIENILNHYDNEGIDDQDLIIELIRKSIKGEIVSFSIPEPNIDPECSASEEELEESNIDCEFENRDGSWWCTTHNCWA